MGGALGVPRDVLGEPRGAESPKSKQRGCRGRKTLVHPISFELKSDKRSAPGAPQGAPGAPRTVKGRSWKSLFSYRKNILFHFGGCPGAPKIGCGGLPGRLKVDLGNHCSLTGKTYFSTLEGAQGLPKSVAEALPSQLMRQLMRQLL